MSRRLLLPEGVLTELRQEVEAITVDAKKVQSGGRNDVYTAWMDGYAAGYRSVERWLRSQIITERVSE